MKLYFKGSKQICVITILRFKFYEKVSLTATSYEHHDKDYLYPFNTDSIVLNFKFRQRLANKTNLGQQFVGEMDRMEAEVDLNRFSYSQAIV